MPEPSSFKCRMRGSAVILDADLRVVLVRQDPHGDYWCLPGGGAEPGELAREAMVREVCEETGLTVVCERMLWMTEHMQRLPGRVVHQVDACYAARVVGKASTAAEHEWGYFGRHELPSDNIWLPPDFWAVVDRRFSGYDPASGYGQWGGAK